MKTLKHAFRCGAVCCLGASTLPAQVAHSVRFLDVGSERERVLRVLQLTGDVPLYPWSVRQFGPREVDRLTPRESRARSLLPLESSVHVLGPLSAIILPLKSGFTFNSAFPYGSDDGAVWAGRGLTGSVSGGFAGRVGPLSFQFEPIAFATQNSAFPLKPNGVPGSPYLNGFYPVSIDLPQRFGATAYGRIDPGQSSIRLDAGPVAAELSTANQWWGPALEGPLLLGNNAAGFPHLALGTAHPIGIGIGSIHGHVVWGRLAQSSFAPTNSVSAVRFMSGVIGVFTPRGAPGLELGAARFFHSAWPTDGWRHAPFGRPFEGVLKQQLATSANPTGNSSDNQLASVFFRWAFPGSGLEVYGEYGREDHNQDARDFWQELDHDAGYVLGFQKAWKQAGESILVLRAEILNTRWSHLQQGREQAPWYVHGKLAQGHTVDGQALGAIGAFGGGASFLGVDRLSPSGRWTVEWTRTMRGEFINASKLPSPDSADVVHALVVERSRNFAALTVFASGAALVDFNRDFGRDRFGVNLNGGLRRSF